MTKIRPGEEKRLYRCPECGAVASVAPWCKRPICVHSWDYNKPEIWDGDDVDGNGRSIEESPNRTWRTPGLKTWTEMLPLVMSNVLEGLARNEQEWLEREYAEGRRVRRPGFGS